MKAPVMSAVRWSSDDEGARVRLEEVRRVRPASGQVLVRVGAVALDRRDGETTVGPRPTRPGRDGRRTMGRHVAGTVAAPGAGVDGWPLGRPVAVQPEVAVGRGWFVPGTRDEGGLAEYVVVPVDGLVRLASHLPVTTAALLPLVARAHSLLVHAGACVGMSVGIWGAGSLGGAALDIARLLGASPLVVVDPSATARAAARDRGADLVLDPADPDLADRLSTVTAGRGVDLALHAAPEASSCAQALAALSPEGRGVLAGPVAGLGDVDRWDGRTLSGLPRADPHSLRLVAHLAATGRLHLSPRPLLPGGLTAAAEVLDAAVRAGSPVESCVVEV